MKNFKKSAAIGLILSCCLTIGIAMPASAAEKAGAESARPAHRKAARKIDRSGEARRGKASYYAKKFAGRKMADGTRMNPEANIAASRTLPLGTKARVTNLDNGKSAVVEIRDRGPYIDGRIIDVSPKVARKLDFHDEGIAPVVVTPLELPETAGGKTDIAAAGD